MIIVSKYIVPKGYVDITLFPFIFLKSQKFKNDSVLLNHERIHLKQQLELFIVFFYIFYGIEWFIKFIKYRNIYSAYKNISFEREAYTHEKDMDYLKKRSFWMFISYL
ncbi:conserved hypothetical protein [Tenacibaculum amylolyticum]